MKKKLIQEFETAQAQKSVEGRKQDFPKFKVGDTISVKYKITEGATTRLQAFQGVVIAKAKADDNYSASFTVRKISSGIGVERKFITHSPLISSIEVMKKGVVRRAKLYYLRALTGKASRIKERLNFNENNESAKAEIKKKAPKAESKPAEVKKEEAPKTDETK